MKPVPVTSAILKISFPIVSVGDTCANVVVPIVPATNTVATRIAVSFTFFIAGPLGHQHGFAGGYMGP
jgi:hypothetical protein